MEIIIFYVISSYVIHMGMIVNDYASPKQVPTLIKVSLLFSPLSILLILGMLLSDKIKYYEKNL